MNTGVQPTHFPLIIRLDSSLTNRIRQAAPDRHGWWPISSCNLNRLSHRPSINTGRTGTNSPALELLALSRAHPDRLARIEANTSRRGAHTLHEETL